MSDKYAAVSAAKPFRADGGDISVGRIKEIADNVYGDEEKVWIAKRALELLAERDADKARIAELERFNAGLAQESFEYQQRVAELEARTLTVKLPQRQECEGYHIDEAYLTPADDGDCYYRDEVIESIKEACDRAGISLKIEGE